MSASLLLISDTHVRGRGRDLPPALWAAVDAADVVIHAGDWVAGHLLDAVVARARRLVAVSGNCDGPDLRARLPAFAAAELEGLKVGVVHETGTATGREDRCERRFPGLDLLVFGHSHTPWDRTSPGGLRLLNPGSPTDRRAQPAGSYVTATADAGRLRDVRLHGLGPGIPAWG